MARYTCDRWYLGRLVGCQLSTSPCGLGGLSGKVGMAFDDVISRQALPFASTGALPTKRVSQLPHIKSICIELEVPRRYSKKKAATPGDAYDKVYLY